MSLLKGVKGLSAVLLLTTIAVVDGGTVAIAQSPSKPLSGLVAQRRRRLSFRVGVRPSQFRVGGFSRSGSCGNDRQPLIALVPPPQSQETAATSRSGQDPVDKTISDRPTFLVYAPYTTAKTAQFTLQNESGNQELYNVKFQLTGKPGIVAIALPQTGPALQVGQKYVWQVSVACSADDLTNTVVISSWIERVPPLASHRIAALAEQGIWQDAAAQLALSRFQQPNERAIAEDWAALMDDAGLSRFKQTAIVQVVKN